MKVQALLLKNQQPWWFRLPVTVAIAFLSLTFPAFGIVDPASLLSTLWTMFTFAALFSFFTTLIPIIVIFFLPKDHPIRELKNKDEELSKQCYSYNHRDFFWEGLGVLIVLFAGHGLPGLANSWVYAWGAILCIGGIRAMFSWRTKWKALETATAIG